MIKWVHTDSWNIFNCYLWNNQMNKRKAYSFVNDLMFICTGNSYYSGKFEKI
jgi:hypothetical protein